MSVVLQATYEIYQWLVRMEKVVETRQNDPIYLVLIIVAGLASVSLTCLGLVVGGWGGSYSFQPNLQNISWILLTLSLPVFLSFFVSRDLAVALSWMLVGASFIAIFIGQWYLVVVMNKPATMGLRMMLLKTLARFPSIWVQVLMSISLQLGMAHRHRVLAAKKRM